MKKFMKWTGIVFGGLIGLVLLSGLILYPIGMRKLTRTYPNIAVETVSIHTGVLPNGRRFGPTMSSKTFSELNDMELAALWLYFTGAKP